VSEISEVMVYRKRSYRRRRRMPPKGRRQMRRRLPPVRVPRGVVAGRTHIFKRVKEFDPIQFFPGDPATNGPQPVLWSKGFRLNEVPNHTEFTSLFDQYRINKIKLTLVPNWTNLNGAHIPWSQPDVTGNSPSYLLNAWYLGNPNIHSVIDHDDLNMTGANVSTLMQYPNYRMTRGNRIHSRYFTPAIATGVYDGTANTVPGGVEYKRWIDCNEADIIHFGVKVFVDPGALWDYNTGAFQTDAAQPSMNIFIRVYATYYMEFKGVR